MKTYNYSVSWLCNRVSRRAGTRPPWLPGYFLVCLLITGCGSSGGGGQEQAGDEVLVIESVREVGVIESGPSITMQDCGYSARIGDRTVWVFGDSFLDTPNEDDQRVLSNSWSYTYDMDAGDGLAGFKHCVDAVGAPTSLIPLTSEETAYNEGHAAENCMEEPCGTRWAIWPGAIIDHPDEDVAYVFYHKFLIEAGQMNFRHIGDSIAVWKDLSGPAERREFDLIDDHPTLLFPCDGSAMGDGFGSAAVLVGRVVYVYGCEFSAETATNPCTVARVPVGHLLEREKWKYYDGSGGWSSEIHDAAWVLDGSNMMSVFYSDHLDRYLAVYSKPMSAQIMLRSARTPHGPWSDEIRLISAERPVNELGWIYDGLAHPEFSPDGGRTIYVTYSRQQGPLKSEMRLVEVQLGTRYEG